MSRYRKKPVEIEAVQYGPATCAAICAWMGIPHNVAEGEPCGVGEFLIETLEGTMKAQPGDWIIRGVKGEFYPCKPDIFAATYEPSERAPASDAGTGPRETQGERERLVEDLEFDANFLLLHGSNATYAGIRVVVDHMETAIRLLRSAPPGEPDAELVREIGRLRGALSFVESADFEGEAEAIARVTLADTPPHIARLFPFAPGEPVPLAITDAEFASDREKYIKLAMEERQVIVRDEAGRISLVLGISRRDLFPEDWEAEWEPEQPESEGEHG